MVERAYMNGVPKHRLPSARSVEFDADVSGIFVVSWEQFSKMSSKEIQGVFRNRDILVTGAPIQPLSFDKDGLSTLADLKEECFL